MSLPGVLSLVLASEGGDVVGALFLMAFVGAWYFLPTFIAFGRKKASAASVLVVNLFLGWTVIGWIACLAWAFSTSHADLIKKQISQQ